MITRLGIHPHDYDRPRRETERELLMRRAREILGDEVVEHYLHAARTEQHAFDAVVTDWELYRGFERM